MVGNVGESGRVLEVLSSPGKMFEEGLRIVNGEVR